MKPRWLILSASCTLVFSLLALGATSVQASPKTDSSTPCGNHLEVASLVKEAEYPTVTGNFYTELSYCARPFGVACAAQQFNPQHNINVPFYKDPAFYHRCEGAYALVRTRSNPRHYSYGICGVVSWAAIIGGPWVPEVTLAAKLATVIFGVSLKELKCG
jgi:hypothetical protein